jgi:aminoglycoside phosphotransferase (APT) family kinase protein
MNWVMPANGRSGLLDIDFASLDIPSLEEMLDIYCAATGRPPLPNLHWYFAYNLFRLVGIVQGVKKRMLDGNASSAKAEETVAELVPLARAAWEQARLAGASRARGETQS